MLGMSLAQIASGCCAVGVIGGGALTLDHLHVASADFKEYIEQQQENDERDYILSLKKDIREVRFALSANPGDEYLTEALAEMIAELCLIRAQDRLCSE